VADAELFDPPITEAKLAPLVDIVFEEPPRIEQ
jgi:hypothetical protein